MHRYQNSLHFKFFPISVEGGGVIENQFFPKFIKVQIILGEGWGGGQENYGLFPQIMVFFYFEPSPYMFLKNCFLISVTNKAIDKIEDILTARKID